MKKKKLLLPVFIHLRSLASLLFGLPPSCPFVTVLSQIVYLGTTTARTFDCWREHGTEGFIWRLGDGVVGFLFCMNSTLKT